MTPISTVPRICKLVNTFTVDPQNQERLLETLIDATEKNEEQALLRLGDYSQELRWYEVVNAQWADAPGEN